MYDIEVKDLCVYYNSVCALKNVNLKVKNNEFLGIIGPNGSGKTTLLKVLLGLIKPTTGSIRLRGDFPVGYVPQYSFFDRSFPVNVLDVILMGRLSKRIKWFQKYSLEDKNHAKDIMNKLGILQIKNRQIGELSGGQLQKVLIARALVSNPKILVLDEPTANLDTKTQQRIYEILNKLKEDKTILMVTHDLKDILSYVDSVAYVNNTLHYYKNDFEGNDELFEKIYGYPLKVFMESERIHNRLKSHKEGKDDRSII